MSNIKFSVLIPVYNVEKYIRECLDSVVCQSYKNFEVIIVDDGSTDSSGRICDEYAQKHNFIKVIHQENSGQFMARQVALNQSTGDYCVYIDSDDFWKKELLEKICVIIDKHQCDMVIFDRIDVFEKHSIDVKLQFKNEEVFENERKRELYNLFLEGDNLNNLVQKVFKRELSLNNIDNFGFEGICYGEDAFKSACLVKNASKIVYLSECLYNYRRNVGVTSYIPANLIEKVTYKNTLMLDLLAEDISDFERIKEKSMVRYMKNNVKYVVYGYIRNPEVLLKTIDNVCKTKYYQEARLISRRKLNLLEKNVLKNAENGKLMFISIISKLVNLRNKVMRRKKHG